MKDIVVYYSMAGNTELDIDRRTSSGFCMANYPLDAITMGEQAQNLAPGRTN